MPSTPCKANFSDWHYGKGCEMATPTTWLVGSVAQWTAHWTSRLATAM